MMDIYEWLKTSICDKESSRNYCEYCAFSLLFSMTTPPIAGSENVWVWLLFLNFYSFPNFIAEKFNIHNMASFARSLQRICTSSLRPQLKVKSYHYQTTENFLFFFLSSTISLPLRPCSPPRCRSPPPPSRLRLWSGVRSKKSLLRITRWLEFYLLTCIVHALFASQGKYVVVYFYPLDFTFVCPTEIIAFSDRIKEFEAINTAVLGK